MMTDEDYFDVDKFGYLRLFVGRSKMVYRDTTRKYKVRLRGGARPMILSYDELLRLNSNLMWL